MCPLKRYPILQSLLSPFRRSQQKTLAWAIAGILEVAQARSLTLAAHWAAQRAMRVGSALNRFYRLLHNERIDDQRLTQQMLSVVSQSQSETLVALDWTDWPHGLQMLVAAVVVGTRAIPVQTHTVKTADLAVSQNAEEETFFDAFWATVKGLGIWVVLLCDRGFRRVDWLKKLLKELRAGAEACGGFVVRLKDDVLVHKGGKKPRALRDFHLQPGQAIDLGEVGLRQDKAVKVRVVGVWAPGQKEAWWLATNLEEPLAVIVGYYDRRMGVEEQLRDSKGCRFGVQMEWTQFRTPQYLSRLALLVGVAMRVWTAVGAAVAEEEPSVQMPCKQKGARLSLLRVGIHYLGQVVKQVRVGVRFVVEHLPGARVRRFARLQRLSIRAAFA